MGGITNINLIADAWIPVVGHDGRSRNIAPWQVADGSILRLDWPRADLNVACLEFLIGLLLLADPPEDIYDWQERAAPDPDRLKARLAPFAPAFNLLGKGPRFLQDFAAVESQVNSPDMLFIDSVGANTIKNNADLMVWRGRYPALPLPLAAIALYTLQSFAPSGGAGNRTSMRGGGPMVTLVVPEDGLWAMLWANVPYGTPAGMDALPWMKPTITSEKDQKVYPQQARPVEAFFGMPRRLRLVAEGDLVTGVMQRPYGVNYAGWDHPLTPYYRLKTSDEWLPKHPRAGLFGYRNWVGVTVAGDAEAGLRRRARTLEDWFQRGGGNGAQVLVAGWAMDNMKPLDFTLSAPPFVRLQGAALGCLLGMIEAADLFGVILRAALKPVLAEGEAREAVREAFYARTQSVFEARLAELERGRAPLEVAADWLADMRRVALSLFEVRALPGLSERKIEKQQEIVMAHRNLGASFAGFGKLGGAAYAGLGLPAPARKEKEAA